VVADGQHRYDAWIVNGCLPLIVFAPGSSAVLAWWSDQSDGADDFADGDAVYAAFETDIRQNR